MRRVSKPTPIPYYSPYALTDCGNAERLVDQHGECIRYCGAMRHWFLWNGYHWSADDGAAVQLAKKTIRAMQQERNNMLGEGEGQFGDWEIMRRRADALEKWATRSEGAPRIVSFAARVD
jgi:hypothetical protein